MRLPRYHCATPKYETCWSRRRVLNLQPHDYRSCALPDLSYAWMVPTTGFEPALLLTKEPCRQTTLRGKKMKLLFCKECQDVVKLLPDRRYCACGKSFGNYLDDLSAVIGGAAVPLGFENSSLAKALRERPAEGLGQRFEAFVIPLKCPTIGMDWRPV